MQNYAPGEAYYQPVNRQTSKLGKASLMMALATLVLVIVSVVVMIVLAVNNIKSANAVIAVTLIGWVLAPGGHLIGMILGIVDVCRQRSKKLVPALGIAANAILGAVGFGLLIFVGNEMLKGLGAFH